MIEPAKSGRARCRKCREKIEKGELRLGVQVEGYSDEPSWQWYHLPCAAEKVPAELGAALMEWDGEEIEGLDGLKASVAKNKKKQKASTFPYAERAPSARSTCIMCSEKIAKETFRVAVERDIDTGAFVTRGARYIHPACVSADGEIEDLEAFFEELAENSIALEEAELNELADQLA